MYHQSHQDQIALLQKTEDSLTRLDPGDDIEAYLTTFEQTATLARWPPAQWTYILGPYLSGPTLMVWQTLLAEDVASYAKLKDALLDRYSITEDSFCHHFRAM